MAGRGEGHGAGPELWSRAVRTRGGSDCRGEGSCLCGSVQAHCCGMLGDGCTVWLEGEGE